MNKFYKSVFAFLIVVGSSAEIFAQTLSDGPIELQVKLRDMNVGFNETDVSILGVGFGPDEPTFKVWARDQGNVSGLGWQGGMCHTFPMGTGGPQGLPGLTPAVNETMFNFTYPKSESEER